MVFQLLGSFKDFIDFTLVDALDVDQLLLCRHYNGRHCAKSCRFKFGNISGIDATVLKLLNLDKISSLELLSSLLLLLVFLLFIFGFVFLLLFLFHSNIINLKGAKIHKR